MVRVCVIFFLCHHHYNLCLPCCDSIPCVHCTHFIIPPNYIIGSSFLWYTTGNPLFFSAGMFLLVFFILSGKATFNEDETRWESSIKEKSISSCERINIFLHQYFFSPVGFKRKTRKWMEERGEMRLFNSRKLRLINKKMFVVSPLFSVCTLDIF